MKASKLAAALGMSVGLIATGAAYAADTSNMTVQAAVVGSCKFNSTPTLDFGNLDPANVTNGSGSSTISFWCTKGSAYTVTAGNGNNYDAGNSTRQMKGPGRDRPDGVFAQPARCRHRHGRRQVDGDHLRRHRHGAECELHQRHGR